MCSCGGPQCAGGRLGLPEAILAEQGVEQADELAHDGDEGDLVRLAAGEESFVEGLGRGFATDRGQGRHVEQVARLGAAAADGAAAAVLAGVAVEGSEAEQGSGLAAAEGAELGHVGAEAGGGDGAATGDRADAGGAAGECGVGGDALAHAALAVGAVGLEGLERGAGTAGGCGVEFGTELAEGAELLDELAAEGEQVAEELEVVRLGRGGLEAVEEAEAGEHGGIDAVVLGESSDGFGEAAGAQGVDQDGLEAGLSEALVEVAVVAAGGLEDGPGDAVLEQPVAQGAAAGLGVVELALEAGVEDVGVEPGLADIDAGDYDGIGTDHSCIPVLLRFGAVPTLPFRSRRNGCDGPTKLQYGSWSPRKETVRSVVPGGAWPGPTGDLPTLRRGGI